MNNTLWIIRGISGSGKTTEAYRLLQEGAASAHFEADMWFDQFNEGKFDATLLGKAHGWCKFKVQEALLAGQNVIVSNTFIKQWEMKDYKAFAAANNIQVIEKTMTGEFKNVHGVPDEKVAQMKRNFQP
jgi:predicted kinase